ncbi:hypothetical protein TNCV_4375541 [Trichonephila clavipes]|uniref:Transposase n=1 Tax=Trichonephila clavipes TaxID=2585209 RepID=A0A8X7BCU2_TRICX|nr:hypothetical protein TNCV_4375541 [Trichonephila clavipes]
MFDGLVAFAVDRWRHDCGSRRLRVHITARVTIEGKKVRSGYLPFRTNASTLPITPRRPSSRDVGTSSYKEFFQFGLTIHQNDHQARRRFVEWAQNEFAVVPDFHKRILFSDVAHFWLNGYVNKQNCRIWREANPQVYVETPLHPEKLFGALYGLVESLVRTSSKTMKATTL